MDKDKTFYIRESRKFVFDKGFEMVEIYDLHDNLITRLDYNHVWYMFAMIIEDSLFFDVLSLLKSERKILKKQKPKPEWMKVFNREGTEVGSYSG